jgi:hypothetical protein
MTARESIAGVEGSWASSAALEPCPHCGAVHPADWVHVPAHCRRPPRPRAKRRKPAPADDLRALVLGALGDAPLPSTNAVTRAVPRRRADVRATLRQLEADGLARRNGAGWQVTP